MTARPRPSRFAVAGLALAAMVFAAPTALAQKKAPKGAKVLLLSGGQREHHGYRDQSFYIANLLEDTGRYQVTIAEDAAVLEAPTFPEKYDVLLMIADRRDPEFKLSAAQQEAILGFVKRGRGYVSVHGADNAAPDWLPGMREMLGGVFSHDTRGGRPDGKVRKGAYPIKVADTGHPVTRGLKDFTLQDELYYQIQMEPGVEPLLTAEFEGKAWPVAWTRKYGNGRVFHTPLGHRDFGPGKDDPLRDPNLSRLIVQGVDWVADREPSEGRSP